MAPSSQHQWTNSEERKTLWLLLDQIAANFALKNLKDWKQKALLAQFKPHYLDNFLSPASIWYYGENISDNGEKVLPGQI